MAALPLGIPAVVKYMGYDLWHERVPVVRVNEKIYVVVTPELDMYSETLAVPPLAGLRRLTENRRLSGGLRAGDVHRFQLDGRPGGYFTKGELKTLLEEGRDVAFADADYDEEYGEAAEGLGPLIGEAWKSCVEDSENLVRASGASVESPVEGEEAVRLGTVVLLKRGGELIICDVRGARAPAPSTGCESALVARWRLRRWRRRRRRRVSVTCEPSR